MFYVFLSFCLSKHTRVCAWYIRVHGRSGCSAVFFADKNEHTVLEVHWAETREEEEEKEELEKRSTLDTTYSSPWLPPSTAKERKRWSRWRQQGVSKSIWRWKGFEPFHNFKACLNAHASHHGSRFLHYTPLPLLFKADLVQQLWTNKKDGEVEVVRAKWWQTSHRESHFFPAREKKGMCIAKWKKLLQQQTKKSVLH